MGEASHPIAACRGKRQGAGVQRAIGGGHRHGDSRHVPSPLPSPLLGRVTVGHWLAHATVGDEQRRQSCGCTSRAKCDASMRHRYSHEGIDA